MKIIKITLLFVFGFLLFSCAERYSSRKRTGNKAVIEEKTSVRKPKTTDSAVFQKTKNQKKNTEKEVRTTKRNESETVETKRTNSYSLGEQQQVVLDTALSYLGSPYKYGGTTRSGFDCSGFVSAAFAPVAISLHRSSHEMAEQGKPVDLKNVQIGDLLFFVTGKSKRISHVGIVVETEKEIKFIHSSTSRGVIISSMNEGYWSKAYRKARRVM
ncbi:C40 family peptidase [Capnocytophaga sp.]|uniref:C40 family peptidase n=1 Tax=Capnocytophaga sp. TaxID=44737 RepID=UPI0026DA967D|nr:C40 family peptidase [Capnocytophaga sp.]MDO5104792.1 NlpC/P60 family protein [Capnocytophaga sp.]